MASYGVELVQKTLKGQVFDNGRVGLVVDLLATLCATLIDTQDKHRAAVDRAIQSFRTYAYYGSGFLLGIHI